MSRIPPIGILCCLLLAAVPVAAQTETASTSPLPPLTGSVSFGAAISSGNSPSSNLNLAFEAQYDPKSRHVFKVEGLYLRGTKDGDLSVNRMQGNARDDYRFDWGGSVFVQTQYVRDPFKGIERLIAPTVGVGVTAVKGPAAEVAFDAGIGGVWETNVGARTRGSGALTAGEKLAWKLSASAELVQSVTALWKLERSGDALYNGAVGLTAALTSRSQLKIQLLDSYKTRLTSGARKKNDVSLITAIVFKF